MRSFTWFVALLAMCSWSFVASVTAQAHPGTEIVLDCEDEDGEDESRTLDCEDEDGDDEGRVLDCHDEEEGDDASRSFDCEDEDGEDEGRVLSRVLDCDEDHEESEE